MPTVPLPENEPHRQRQVAESFGTDAERYDRARPRYPEALVERIVAGSTGSDVPGVPKVLDVLDVGCGTGIVARQFQAAGCRVLGVEPDPRMAGLARQLGTEVDVATFEAWDPAGRTFDTVVAGQTWHWVDPVAGAAAAARVLRPGGRLAVFWNVSQLPSDVAEAFAAVCQRVLPQASLSPPMAKLSQALTKPAQDAYQAMVGKAVEGAREAGGFGEPEQWRFDWEWHCTRDAWLDQLPTVGILTTLPSEKLAEVLEGAGAAVDAVGGSFTMRYATVAVALTRRAAA